MSRLTHLDDTGAASMVDVSDKAVTERSATASARLRMAPDTLALVNAGGTKKGDVLAVARIAGIQAAKKTAELIPLCHPIALTGIDVQFETLAEDTLGIRATCRLADRTGVEMEAMTAASVAALTVYDMCKGVDRGMVIEAVALEHKAGGRTGEWTRGDAD